MPEERVVVAPIVIPSTEIDDIFFSDSGGNVTIGFTFSSDDRECLGRIEFEWPRAYRHRAESHCTRWHTEGAYDTLVEIRNSEWVAELLEAMPEDMRDMFEMHHYMIYFDSEGCYEVVAESAALLPDVPVEGDE